MALTSPGLIKGANQVLVDLAPELNLIKLFSYDCSDAVAEAGAKIRVSLATGGTAETYNASTANYEHETGSLDDVFVTLSNQPKSTIGLTSMDALELAESPYWNKFSEATANSVSASISATIGGLFTTSNCTGGKIVMASVTKAAIAGLRADCVGRVSNTVLLLNPTYYADLLGLLDSGVFGGTDPIQSGYVSKLYGFRAVAQANDLPSGVLGVLLPSNSIAIASRTVAIPDPSCYSEYGTVTDENGFALTVLRHGSAATGKAFLNTTCLFGANFVKKSWVKYIAAA